MQYLIKFSLEGAPLWRLTALEGSADLAHTAKLIALSFNYPEAFFSYEVHGQEIFAGFNGALTVKSAVSLDSLKLNPPQSFAFKVHLLRGQHSFADFLAVNEQLESLEDLKKALPDPELLITLSHRSEIFKKEERLYCLMPSTLVGAHKLADDGRDLTCDSLCAYLDEETTIDSLNLKECTERMRALGAVRSGNQFAGLELRHTLLS